VHGQKIAAHNNEKPRQTFDVVDVDQPGGLGGQAASLANPRPIRLTA